MGTGADRSQVLRVAVGLLGAAGLVGGVLNLLVQLLAWQASPGMWAGTAGAVTEIARLLSVPAFAGLALVIAWRSPISPGSIYGGLFLSVYALWGLAVGSWFDERVWRVAYVTVADWVAHAAAVRFSQVFPSPLRPADLRCFGPGVVGRAATRLYSVLLDPRVFWPAALIVEVSVRLSGSPPLYFAHVIGVCALAAGYLYASYRRGSEEERQRIFWLMEGAVVFLTVELAFVSLRAINALGIFAIELAAWAPWLSMAQTWLALLCFALAIFYRGAFDSRMVLRRTTVASASAVLGVVVFITLETAVTETIEGIFGFESQLGTIVAGVVVALLLRPVTLRIDRRLDGMA